MGAKQKLTRGRLLDLSVGGAFITAVTRPEIGAGAFLTFTYWGNHACEATGHVVRILPFGSEIGVGIELAFANEAFLSFLKTYERTAEALRPELIDALADIQVRLP